jgi:lysyl-tRNA synthetase class I
MPTETVDELIEQLKNIKIQEDTVLEKLSQARRQEKETQENTQGAKYSVGDWVFIKNTVRKPVGRSVNTNDRKATVLYTTSDGNQTKVYIRTDNGTRTWRLEKNLRSYNECN